MESGLHLLLQRGLSDPKWRRRRFGVFVGTVKFEVGSSVEYGHGGALSSLNKFMGCVVAALMRSCRMGGGRGAGRRGWEGHFCFHGYP